MDCVCQELVPSLVDSECCDRKAHTGAGRATGPRGTAVLRTGGRQGDPIHLHLVPGGAEVWRGCVQAPSPARHPPVSLNERGPCLMLTTSRGRVASVPRDAAGSRTCSKATGGAAANFCR